MSRVIYIPELDEIFQLYTIDLDFIIVVDRSGLMPLRLSEFKFLKNSLDLGEL